MKVRVAIIGGGVIGCAVAREMSMFDTDLLVLERAADVSEGASKANSGIVHAGHDAVPGSMKARFNIQGSAMMEALCKALTVPYKQNGALVLAFNDEQISTLNELYEQGMQNGVDGLEILDTEQVLALENHTNPNVKAALHVKTSALVSPYELTFALADHAKLNGAEFLFDTHVSQIEKRDNDTFFIHTNHGDIRADIVINCAGVGAGQLHNQIAERKVSITPRKGEYYLLDHEVKPAFAHTMFQTPTKMGKGILITPTLHEGLLLGPTAMDIQDGLDVSTTADALREVREVTSITWPAESLKTVITTFSGIRAHEADGDFIVGGVEGILGAYEAIGIESPGLSSAPAIGRYIAELIADDYALKKKDMPVPPPVYLKAFASMSLEEKQAAYRTDPAYGSIVCRCEQITEAEVRAAIRRPVGATTLDGVKRRVRAGMGRCQGGFCSPRVMEILSEELQKEINQITKSVGNSVLLSDRIEDVFRELDDRHE